MNNRLRRMIRGIDSNGGEPQPTVRRVLLTKVQYATVQSLIQAQTEITTRLNGTIVGILAGHDIEASEGVKLVGVEDGQPSLEFKDHTATQRWKREHQTNTPPSDARIVDVEPGDLMQVDPTVASE